VFKKLKEFCSFKKEKQMTTNTTDNRTTKQLKKTISEQSNEISRLRTRVSELVDDIHTIKADISNFKTSVSNDMKGLVEVIKNK
jgi:molecular chaperone GrpE (heat shock protein)|tara:strand:- start:493 stop:744 length:252 start_codon:yes stop_codon:yes gene_type:complete